MTTLLARISGDSKYQANPLVAEFDIAVGQATIVSLSELFLFQVLPFIAALIGALVFLLKKR